MYNTVLVPLDGSELADGRDANRTRSRNTIWRHRSTRSPWPAPMSSGSASRRGSSPSPAISATRSRDVVHGSGAADIIHTSTAPTLVVPVQAVTR